MRFTRLAALAIAPATILALASPALASSGSQVLHSDNQVLHTVAKHAVRPAATIYITMNANGAISGSRRVFRIHAGKRFDIVAHGMTGVRSGYRLGVQSRYRTRPKRLGGRKHWHLRFSWRLHRGQHNLRRVTRGTTPGLFTLRLHLLRGRHHLVGRPSNRFKVRVTRFHFKHLHRPHHGGPNAALPAGLQALFSKGVTNPVINWQEPIECAPTGSAAGGFNTVGRGVLLTPPFEADLNFTGRVVQFWWYENAQPGGSFGNIVSYQYLPQTLTTTDGETFSLGAGGDTILSDQLGNSLLYFPNDPTEYHAIFWDLAFQDSDGSWHWVNTQELYQPNTYEQFPDRTGSPFTSQFCETFNG
jgi:hypothetical protein